MDIGLTIIIILSILIGVLLIILLIPRTLSKDKTKNLIRCLKDSPCDNIDMSKITKNKVDKLSSDLHTSNEIADREKKLYEDKINKLEKELEEAKNK